MRNRYQKGSLTKVGTSWIAQWWEDGHRRKRTLGRTSQMTKAQAQRKLAAILAPINAKHAAASSRCRFADLVEHVYLPFFKRKWKTSTARTNEDRIRYHLHSELGEQTLASLTRDQLQDLLDRKADEGLSFSTVNHLRWDLKQIFDMAIAEGYLDKNPAAMLFTPRNAHRGKKRHMSWKEVRKLFSILELRERVIAMLAIMTGMRPGEIFALQWCHIKDDRIEIRQRVYRGQIDVPKTRHSIRTVALPESLRTLILQWRAFVPDSPDSWVFPSETLKTPLARDNCWRRHFAPKLKPERLDWVNFQVMRRTHASLMRELDVDPKVVADQLGHTLDVSLNVYAKSSLELRQRAVDALETALDPSLLEHFGAGGLERRP